MLKKIDIYELQPNQFRLYAAIEDGKIDEIKDQLAIGINLDGYDLSDVINRHIKGDNTSLIVAVILQEVEVIKYLLSNGADSNLKDTFSLYSIGF